MSKFLLPAIGFTFALMTFVSPAFAGKAKDWDQYGLDASIAFPNHGGIRNFEANEERGLWIEDRQRRWYSKSDFPTHLSSLICYASGGERS